MADFVYVMAYADRLHKIGFSNNPFRRLSELQQQDGARIEIVKTWERRGNDAQIIEAQAHQLLAYHRAPDARSDEVFEVGEYAACLAVELAQELVDARPVRVGRTVPLSASMAAAHLSGVAEKTSWFGYLPPFCSMKRTVRWSLCANRACRLIAYIRIGGQLSRRFARAMCCWLSLTTKPAGRVFWLRALKSALSGLTQR